MRSETLSSCPEFRTFENLGCWQACREVRRFVVARVVSKLPGSELHRLGDQLLWAARSATANIAEGYGRYHYTDMAKFRRQARGSLYEVLDHLITGQDGDLFDGQLLAEGRQLVEKAVKLTNGYIRYLSRRKTVMKELFAPPSAP